MRRTKLFIKTRRDAPADEEARNAQLLIRAGFIHKDAAGVYGLLPLGLALVENIKQIVREEMNKLGGQEILMTALQRKELWQKTDRWDDKAVDIWFKSKLQNGTEVGLGWSHEEQVTDMMKEFISSYRDLPAYVYQFQNKLRNELRAKSGLLRAREFLMKDMYSFSSSEAEHKAFYESVIATYKRVYDRLGIGGQTVETLASGGDFTGSAFSHEFQTLLTSGEDTIYLDRTRNKAINEEIFTEELAKRSGYKLDNLEKVQASEVGNIFSFGTDKTDTLGLQFTDEKGDVKPVYLGSYGIGITRLAGVIAELLADERGLVWPNSVAPFAVYLIGLDEKGGKEADKLYEQLQKAGITTLYDDRDERPGEKFADADLMGIPIRLVVSDKSLKSGGAEIKMRTENTAQVVKTGAVVQILAKALQD